MSPISYDLHLHSCLSPCGDNDMTPNNLVNMALLKGLSVIALTDHNTCGNVRATAGVARRAGLGFLPGMELCTSEEIHVVCLFEDCDRAEDFSRYIYERLPPIQNKPTIFGNQLYRDEQDEVVTTEERLLITASSIPISQVAGLVSRWDGVCFPAHIDRESNSLLAILGAFPTDCGFEWVEVAHPERFATSPQAGEILRNHPLLINSDAHYLWDMSEAVHLLPQGDSVLHRLIQRVLRV